MNLLDKLLEIQSGIDTLIKDGRNQPDNYRYVSSDEVLNTIRPKLIDLGLLLIPNTISARVHEGTTKSGTTRYLTELEKLFVWVDVETGERLEVPFYAQGVDLAGEKGVGKAETYAEKYFLLKFFHAPTSKDDPDSDGRTKSGEKKQRGTAAARETTEYVRNAVVQLFGELYENNEETIKKVLLEVTKNDARGLPGKDSFEAISDAAIRVLYGKAKRSYLKKYGREFEYNSQTQE